MATARAHMTFGSEANRSVRPWRAASQALGWFGVALGSAGLIAPRAIGSLIGVGHRPWTLRALGVRELLSGAGILSQPHRPAWMWSRVAGDAMGLALLTAALRTRRRVRHRGRLALATGAVALVTAADVLCSRQLSRGGARALGRPLQLYATVAVQRPAEALYHYWRELSNLPRFMLYLSEVRELEAGRSHWIAETPKGAHIEWDAEITEERPNEMIAWRTLPDAPIELSGSVHFEQTAHNQGTLVRLRLESSAGGATGLRMLKAVTRETLKEQLLRFKQLMETGEIATTEGQPTGQRSAAVRLFNRVGLQ
jgi:uncharacterized membrane protein